MTPEDNKDFFYCDHCEVEFELEEEMCPYCGNVVDYTENVVPSLI